MTEKRRPHARPHGSCIFDATERGEVANDLPGAENILELIAGPEKVESHAQKRQRQQQRSERKGSGEQLNHPILVEGKCSLCGGVGGGI